ncbi:MAG: TIGR01457 family HAD-type hydrolase [Kurthia sp.]
MKQYQSYCFDLDGTVYRGAMVIPEAKLAIDRLHAKGIKPYFVTNNAKMTQRQIFEKLKQMDIEVELDHIMTSAIATAKYVAKYHAEQSVFMIGEDGLREALLSEGITLVEDNADVVVQGIDFHITYEIIEKAGYQLQNGAAYIVTNSDVKIPKEKGFVPGNGSIAQLISKVSSVEPTYIGKPEPHVLQSLVDLFDLSKESMVMVGDNYDTDIQAGIRFGIDTIHVNTGVTRTEEAKSKEQPPSYVLQTLADI